MDRVRKVYFIVTKYILIFILSIVILVFTVNFYIYLNTRKYIYSDFNKIKTAYTVLVPGAMVWSNGKLSSILEDRMENAYMLYKQGKVKRFLLSGDHGTKYYDEVNAMKNYLLKKGIPKEDIFLDHAGFDTYNSVIRAKEIFEVDNLIIVTQKFHLPRAVFIAKHKDIKVSGFIADKRRYKEIKYLKFREKLANIKAVLELIFHEPPLVTNEKIPITGDSSKSFNKPN